MKASKPTGFEYKATKDRKIFISRYGKQIMTIKGERALDLISELEGANVDEVNYILALETGQYKHGNEKVGKWVRSQKGSK